MRPLTAVSLLAVFAACGPTDEQQKQTIVTDMHSAVLTELQSLKAAATDLQAAAPTPSGRGWDATADAAALAAMRAAWGRARTSYEHIEGAIAPLFPDLDLAVDDRYDGFLERLGSDPNLFDGTGVTGMHGIERVLWAGEAPSGIVEFESGLPGYVAAKQPATQAEASDFKQKLCAQLITDVTSLIDQWSPAKIDLDGAYTGLVDLMGEQREKVDNAASNVEESRYSQRTMKDLRDNLDGTKQVYALFQPWLKTKSGGADLDGAIGTGFTSLVAAYGQVQGDAIPRPPSTWSAEMPSATDLQTPFGKLYSSVRDATDPDATGSVVAKMGAAGSLMGFSTKP